MKLGLIFLAAWANTARILDVATERSSQCAH
jgi:hypothetical protein